MTEHEPGEPHYEFESDGAESDGAFATCCHDSARTSATDCQEHAETLTPDCQVKLHQMGCKYSEVIQEWSHQHPEAGARLVREEIDEGCVVLELLGVELQVYVPQDANSIFFATTDDEDNADLNSVLTELSDMPQLRTLREFLTHACMLLRGKTFPSGNASGSLNSVGLDKEGLSLSRVFSGRSELDRGQSTVVLDFAKLQQLQQQLIDRVSAAVSRDRSTAILLLLHARWDDGRLLSQFNTDAETFLISAGVALPKQQQEQPQLKEPELCSVCFAEKAVACLPCGHGLCADDWPSFLKCNLETGTAGGGSCLHLRCPGERCPLLVPPAVFARFLEADDYKKYDRLLNLSCVNDSDTKAWCPARGCELCVAFPSCSSTVLCTCGHAFCFECKLDAHAPAKCSDTKVWLAKGEQMSGKTKCKTDNTDIKPCPNPKCSVLAHKASGCHYLVCTHCKEHWCWQCGDWGGGPSGRPLPHHVYDCNNPINSDWYNQAQHIDLFDNEGKYWFYFERHKNHLSSLGFAEKLRGAVEVMVQEINNEVRFKVQDIQLVRDAAELLIECRRVLAWTYVWAFFERSEANRQLFEFVQRGLETKTEQLSAMIEDRPTHEVLEQPTRLADYVSALRGYLENIKRYTTAHDNGEGKFHLAASQPQAVRRAGPTSSNRKRKSSDTISIEDD